MKVIKNKIFISLMSALCVIGLALGITFSCIELSNKPNQNADVVRTSPENDIDWRNSGNIKINWEGEGTLDSPYLISTPEELAGLSLMVYTNSHFNKCFKQTRNLDMSAYWWNPIGTVFEETYFSGSYDGNGYNISGVFTRYLASDYNGQGLFGNVSIATISNLGVVNSIIEGGSYTGAIVGYGDGVNIENCYSTSTVRGKTHTGGLVGCTDLALNGTEGTQSTIKNSFNTGSVEGRDGYIGGVVGLNNSSGSSNNVINCFNVGAVSGRSSSTKGGVSGYSEESNCYFGGECTLSGANMTAQDAKNLSWFNDSSRWDASSPWNFSDKWTISGDYPVLKNSVSSSDTPTIGKTAPDNDSYWDEHISELDTDWEGSGTEDDPYLISSAAELAGLSYMIYSGQVNTTYCYSGIYFKQTKSLDVSKYWWRPIGQIGTFSSRHFSGIFDGNGNTIAGVFTKAGSTSEFSKQGVFGSVSANYTNSACEIKNLGVVDSLIQGYENIGGIAGSCSNNTVIANCYNKSVVQASGKYVGGIAGSPYKITIQNCYNEGNIFGTSYVGGITAGDSYTTITECYNLGTIAGADNGQYIGGIAGYVGQAVSKCYNEGEVIGGYYVAGICGGNPNAGFNLTDCYNSGLIRGKGGDVAGIIGYIQTTNTSSILNCYNKGAIINEGSTSIGGVVGSINNASANVINCYNVGSVSGNGTYVAGIVGTRFTAGTISRCYYGGDCNLSLGIGGNGTDTAIKIDNLNTFTYAKNKDWYAENSQTNGVATWDTSDANYLWDFDNVWIIDPSQNDGYPILRDKTWLELAADSFAGGDGSTNNPYQIATAEQLAKLAVMGQSQELTDNYILTADIDLSGHVWVPIGVNQTYRLTGIFDGNFHTISNMKVNEISSTYTIYLGLFSAIYYSGTVKNLIIQNANITSTTHSGAIAGLVDNIDSSSYGVHNCIVRDSSVSGVNAGGITGYSWNSVIDNCMVTKCIINGSENAGAILGLGSGPTNTYVTDNGAYGIVLQGRSEGAIYGAKSEGTNCFDGCYVLYTINGAAGKLMFGDSSMWGNWTYDTSLNDGFPIQSGLFWIGGQTGSENVYNYLKNTLGLNEYSSN